MKHLIAALFILLVNDGAVAQNNFEGKIIYKMSNALTGSQNILVTAYFGREMIKAEVQTNGVSNEGMDDLLIDFSGELIYYIQKDSRTYRINSSRTQAMPVPVRTQGKNSIILGHSCSAYKGIDTSKNEFQKDTEINFFYADSLHYAAKKQFSNLEMIPMFTNGTHIGMGMEFIQNTEKGKKSVITLTPQSVTAEKIPDSIFSLTGYTIRKEADNTILMAESDSVMRVADSAVKAATDALKEAVREVDDQPGKSQKNKSKKYPSKNTHTLPTKSTPIKPKD